MEITDPQPFDGSGDASAWLRNFDGRSKKKSPSWKTKRIEKLLVGDAEKWWYGVTSDHWDVLHQKFVVYWIDGLRGEAYKAKCKEIDSAASKAPVAVNWVTADPPPPPKPEPSSSHPIFSVLVNSAILDHHGIYDKAYAQLLGADSANKEKIFRVIWDAAFESGKKCGLLTGRGEVFMENVERGKQLGLEMGRVEFEREQKLKEMNRRSISVDTLDLDSNPATPAYVSTSSQTDPEVSSPPVATSVPVSKLNWADDSDTIPPTVLIPPTSSPRDISALRSNNLAIHPFNSLQRRARRSRFTPRSRQFIPTPIHLHPITTSQSHSVITRRHPHGLGAHRPVQTFTPSSSPFPHPKPVSLDWVGDPRLVELGRILRDLGWVHP
ncbi:hypothetical protein D9758_005024 [Tetrapyrgos nigripes]|uniref:Uncharacterized protein n=1 Tax=Tetrapyrgos nigripes TaxID=182062 RepID=A0A8H5LWS1_9AGAR|nr:hypothetical protein D9758_005024 [Tetrapyrgos nigripes]